MSTPKGTVEVGEITVVTGAPIDVEIPDWLTARDIFGGATPPTSSGYAPYLPDPKDPTKGMKRVALYNINFLGKHFMRSKYFARKDLGTGDFVGDEQEIKGKTAIVPTPMIGQGVGKTLAKSLLAAQVEIFKEYARQTLGSGGTISEAGFDAWVVLRGESGGYDFRNGPHFGGSAIDINAGTSPYTATRTNKGVAYGKTPPIYGGEDFTGPGKKSKSGKALAPVTYDFLKDNVWKPACDAYDRAMAFFFGDGVTADVSHFQVDDKGETHREMDQRFQATSFSLTYYFGLAYDARSKTPKSLSAGETHTPVAFDQFLERVTREWSEEPDSPDGFQKKHPSFPDPAAAANQDFYQKMFDQIVADHEALRLVMVHGSLVFDGDDDDLDPKNPKLVRVSRVELPSPKSGNVSRDPCFGFIDIRPEIVVGLTDVQGIRWGGCMFGAAANGDMMHFDLGYKNNPDVEDDPNPDNLWYFKTAFDPPLKKA